MKSLRICLGLCALAMCLSAFAQRPPKGYNYAYGDFNGDGKKEYVYFIPPKDADRWEELDDFESLYGVLKFTNPSIPSIEVKQCVSGVPCNLGDLNGDGNVDVTDVTMLINAILGQIQIEGGDLNGDGNVDVTDVTTEINIVLGSQN